MAMVTDPKRARRADPGVFIRGARTTRVLRTVSSPPALPHSARPEEAPGRPARTHWDMLMERRTIRDLEELLDERLALLHADQRRKSA